MRQSLCRMGYACIKTTEGHNIRQISHVLMHKLTRKLFDDSNIVEHADGEGKEERSQQGHTAR